jgi:hypothetical protein
MTKQAQESVSLMDLETGENYLLKWAHESLEQEVTSEMGRPRIPGFSHAPSQFLHTDNQQLRFVFVVDADSYEGDERSRAVRVDQARQFLLSMQYPRSSRRVQGAGKPLALLTIPNNLSVRGYIDRVRISHEELFPSLALRRFRAELTLVEEPIGRLTVQDIREMRLSEGAASAANSLIKRYMRRGGR